MHRAAELEVAAQADGEVVEAAALAADGQEVGERLGRVVVAAVARVDDGHRRVHGRYHGRALLGVAHGDDVGVAADDADSVRHALALSRGGAASLGEAEHAAAELEHRGLEAEPRPRGGLEEERRELFILASLAVVLRVGDYLVRLVEQSGYLLGAEVEYVYKVSHFLPPIQLSSEGFARKAMSPGTVCAGI